MLRFTKSILLLGFIRSVLSAKLNLNLWASLGWLFSVFINMVSIFLCYLNKIAT